MSVPVSNMPPEVLSIVFEHVESLKTLAQCRLVCKRWSPLAERAMFGEPLFIFDPAKMAKLCGRLQENPSLRHCIRYLSMVGFEGSTEVVSKDTFKLFMNRNIAYLRGPFDAPTWDNLVDAVRESGERCNKLEALITRSENEGDSYLNAQFYFKASLRELHLSMFEPHTPIYQNVVGHLDQFSNLRELFLSGNAFLFELEQILGQCHHLESIKFGPPFRLWIFRDNMQQWMGNNVQKSTSLMTINVGRYYDSQLIEYLMFKYPNMRNVTMGGYSSAILDAVKNVDMINLEKWQLYSEADLDLVLSTLKSNHNRVILNSCAPDDVIDVVVDLDAKKSSSETLWNMRISETRFSAILSRIITDIAPFQNLKVDYANKNFKTIGVGTNQHGKKYFRQLFDIMSIAKEVCFTGTYICCPSDPVNTLPFQQLEILKLNCNAIDIDVLTLISKFIPKLKNLTLSSCLLVPANPQHHRIDMPHTHLDTLCIISGRPIWESYGYIFVDYTKGESANQCVSIDQINAQISIKQDQIVFVKITCLSSNLVEYYTLKPANPAITTAISRDEYSACTSKSPNITIVCKSLGILKLDLGALLVELKPGVGGPLEASY